MYLYFTFTVRDTLVRDKILFFFFLLKECHHEKITTVWKGSKSFFIIFFIFLFFSLFGKNTREYSFFLIIFSFILIFPYSKKYEVWWKRNYNQKLYCTQVTEAIFFHFSLPQRYFIIFFFYSLFLFYSLFPSFIF